MVGEVVWYEGMKRNKVADAVDFADAFVSHYLRIVFGRNFVLRGRNA